MQHDGCLIVWDEKERVYAVSLSLPGVLHYDTDRIKA